ncbi:hypothetical protein KNV32_gp80 [uncultured phage cr3_1]|jgi:hypothetical protein|uniref:Uncharacterized protein n=1 Tax=uncultured phage cr3_1 TaxID=2772065 RepID=A0A7M1RWG0_9CAUD|nr:hypothetical protein KNV32_gp80 [uncultured phage cr3_1]QOR58626.1 hypothetical protein [uncultured phage cr3_1]
MNEVKDYILKVTVAFEGGVVQKFTFDNPQDYLTNNQIDKLINALPYVYHNKIRLGDFINQSFVKDIENRYGKHIIEIRKVVFKYRN